MDEAAGIPVGIKEVYFVIWTAVKYLRREEKTHAGRGYE